LKTKLLIFFHADLNRKKPLIQPNRSAEFFCANLRKPFFTPPRRIRRKKTLIQPNRSAEFFCANLRETFFTPPRRINGKNAQI
jgi:hypothetical protein